MQRSREQKAHAHHVNSCLTTQARSKSSISMIGSIDTSNPKVQLSKPHGRTCQLGVEWSLQLIDPKPFARASILHGQERGYALLGVGTVIIALFWCLIS